MANISNPRPDFIGKGWLLPPQGFEYEKPTPEEILRLADPKDEWLRLVKSFERLKNGYFDEDVSLFQLVSSSQDSDIWYAGLRILGHAASRDCRWAMRVLFRHPVEDTRMAAYDAALYSADLRLIEPLLVACRNSQREERITIMSRLSHMLEYEPGDLYDDMGELSQEEYEERVVSASRACEKRYGADVAIFEGSPLSLARIAGRVETLCESSEAYEYSGTISMYFDLIEAMTGHSTAGVFDSEITVDPHAAIRVVAELQRSGALERFQPGKRYFFGHPLPA